MSVVINGTNGMSAGPITIADGFTITIPDGALGHKSKGQ